MATKGPARKKPLHEDPIVESLMPDPSTPLDTVQLSGYLGKSDQEGRWRLYLTPDLSEYLDIEENDIVSSHQTEEPASPLGGTILMVKPQANIRRVFVSSSEARAAFLRGDITSSRLQNTRLYLPPSSSATGLRVSQQHTGDIFCDISHLFGCYTHDKNNTFCTVASELPGTADTCGLCTQGACAP